MITRGIHITAIDDSSEGRGVYLNVFQITMIIGGSALPQCSSCGCFEDLRAS